jgi:peptide/nickel transport system substrate-binding protein
MLRRALGAVTAAALTLSLAAAASSQPNAPHRGGVYRVGIEGAFPFSDGLDPTGEYTTYGQVILSNLLVRTLVGYDHVAGAAGNKLVPDVATAVPQPTDGGLTYTFRIKHGVRFGPPVDRQVTSQDFAYSLERLANPKDGAEYSLYYTPIEGFTAFSHGKAKTISGIRTPDASTIVFHLTRPTGDFLYRLAMPATAPLPREVVRCFESQPGKYGRDIVSTGPYMIEAADKVDDSSCAAVKPMSGFDGQTSMTLVRNPDYDPATDSPKAREALPDEFRFTIDSSVVDLYDRIGANELDDQMASQIPPQALERYATTPSLRKYLHVNPGDGVSYIGMNLTQPPFDDVHVRRAMNWVIDKAALRQILGGPLNGSFANHIVPDTIYDGEMSDYAPYRTPGSHGSVANAKAAMKGSPYDTRHDGTCSDPKCKHVLLLTDSGAVFARMLPTIQADAAKIGITFEVRTINDAFPAAGTPRRDFAITIFEGWGKDYADPLTFFEPLFDSRTIVPQGNQNQSLVGITPAQAKALGVTGDVAHVPSVDAQLDRCGALAGGPRLSCYEQLDRTLTTKVVPWVPWLWVSFPDVTSSSVTKWDWDQSLANPAFAHVAVR